MGPSLVWTLGLIFFNAVLCKHTKGDHVTLKGPEQSVYLRDSVTLSCVQTGQIYLYFYKDGYYVRGDTHHQIQYTFNTVRLKISSVSASDQGFYSCRNYWGTQFTEKELKVTGKRRRVHLKTSSDTIPEQSSVTLSCEVEGFKGTYEWIRLNSVSDSQRETMKENSARVSVSDGGVYSCRGWDEYILTSESNTVTVLETVPTVSLNPNWSEIFSGDSLTLRCEIEDRGNTEWTYQWSRTGSVLHQTTREYTISRVTESDSGHYRCRGERAPDQTTLWSRKFRPKVLKKPKATVTGDTEVQSGGKVTLSCSVTPASSGWKYYWFRDNTELFKGSSDQQQISVSVGGVYWCRAGRGDPLYFTENSQSFRVNDVAAVSLEPKWPEIFPGEQVTLRCEIHGADTEWTYEWNKSGVSISNKEDKVMIISDAASGNSGKYSCRGIMRHDQHNVTEWSSQVTLHVSNSKLQPVLSVSPSWLTPGVSVSLSCGVKQPSAGWTFYWYKAVPHSSDSYRYELLPGHSNGTEQDSFTVHHQTNTAGFVCRAGRGRPLFYSEYSQPTFVWTKDVESPVSLTVSPDRSQHFTSDKVSLSCESNSTNGEWRLKGFSQNGLFLQQCSSYWTDQSKCDFSPKEKTNAVFWCESGSGELSNALNITFHSDVVLVSPVHPVTEGRPVSLGCKLNTSTALSSVLFYKNGKLIQNGTQTEFNISAVSKSDEGFYKCEGQEQGQRSPRIWTSPESWISVKSKEQSSSFPVMLIIGLICAIVLLILLLLLWRCRKSKVLYLRSARTNQSSAEDHMTSDDYTSPPNDVTYSVLELKNVKERTCEQEQSCVYSSVRPHSGADENVTYAQVNPHRKGKAKRKTKAKSSPSVAEETLYSEIR